MQYKDYYKILGLRKNANQEEIKRKYRELAKKYHPDRNPNDILAEKRFKDINEAHDILSDSAKKAQYDLMGKNWGSYRKFADQAKSTYNQKKEEGFEFKDLFTRERMNDAFKNVVDLGKEAIFNAKTETTGINRKPKVKEIKTTISLEEAYTGTTRVITVNKNRIRLKLKEGIVNEQKLKLDAKGEKDEEIVVIVEIDENKYFIREENDLHTTAKVSLYEAMLGGKISVPTMQGKILFPIAAETANGKIFRIKGKGMPIYNQTNKFGDLYIKIEVQLPTKLSQKEKELFQQLSNL
ncbi:DnaJ-class molecular chaperone with C-terminal Zn finger domain [Bernardetia litoralis DSM 6794]|uniref:DnaJ-class molecular chaperone with C-terminal Zn finger domain n=1 Tax=Bernardetia litoralis (strain ATCC 23117 / DSM 6794 / NBRC 15988 / NCIMB 1366 / Fx l1 / Sio-4) TaxID=880071 RepID=I4AJA2_BERLS|nr:DnaJ C-terminal domain-containing protein [Bernardetia litoralis]AFM04037.1 DnaJ-class molecular chaperone with C-terminal Zn finger domain [Bernardetia litoralis DSM 6794]